MPVGCRPLRRCVAPLACEAARCNTDWEGVAPSSQQPPLPCEAGAASAEQPPLPWCHRAPSRSPSARSPALGARGPGPSGRRHVAPRRAVSRCRVHRAMWSGADDGPAGDDGTGLLGSPADSPTHTSNRPFYPAGAEHVSLLGIALRAVAATTATEPSRRKRGVAAAIASASPDRMQSHLLRCSRRRYHVREP